MHCTSTSVNTIEMKIIENEYNHNSISRNIMKLIKRTIKKSLLLNRQTLNNDSLWFSVQQNLAS